MSYEIAYCNGCRVLQVKPEPAANMPPAEIPQYSMGFSAYCPVCRENKVFDWTELKLDPEL